MGSARAFFRDPVAYVRGQGRAPAPLRLAAWPSRFVLIRDPDTLWRVLVTDATNYEPGKWKRRARRFFGATLNTLAGPAHRERRLLLTPALDRRRVRGFAPAIAERAAAVDAAWTDGAPLDLRRDLERLSLLAAGDALLAADLEAVADELLEGLGAVMAAVPRLLPPVPGTAGGRALTAVERHADELLRTSSGEGDDLASVLSRSGLSRELARGELIAHLAAVVDEPPSALTAAWYFLAADPDADERLRAELAGTSPAEVGAGAPPPFLDAVLRESLRLLPPARHIDRCPVADVTLDGEVVRRGTTVLLSPLVTHREESLYPDADRFVPERWLDGGEGSRPRGAFVPFGAGPHACIGEPFARTIMGAAMATIVPRWRLTLDGDQPPPVPRTPRPRFLLERR